MYKISRRALISTSVAIAIPSIGLAQHSQPLKILVAYPPGGASDATARLFAERLAPILSRPVVVENRAGADGIIAMDAVAKAPKDGSVLGFVAISPFAITAHLRKLPFDAKDVVPLAPLMYSPALVLATPATPAKTLAEVLDQAKKKPGSVRWGNSGSVSLAALILEQIKATSGADILLVPYKGGAQQIMDALSGQFELMAINAAPSVLEHVKEGKLRVLAVTGPRRIETLAQVPTLAELGFADANMTSHFGLFLPSGVSGSITTQLNAAINKVIADPEFKARVVAMGNELTGGTGDDLAKRIDTESRANAKIIQRGRVRIFV